jgi:F-box interacting protein
MSRTFPLHENISATRLKLQKEPKLKLTNDYSEFLYPVGCCNGLLCLFGHILTNNHAEIWLYLCNPATKTVSNNIVFLSKSHNPRFGSSLRHGWKFAFGYDNSTDKYKIVAFHLRNNDVRVFSFGDNVWRNIQSFYVVPIDRCGFPSTYKDAHPGINNGVYVSGTLNWLSIQNNSEYKNEINWNRITIDQFVIISLDLSTETYLQLLPPWDFDNLPCLRPTLAVLMDSLCLSFSHGVPGTHFIIWQMKDFGVQESWTKFLKISYKNLRRCLPIYWPSLLFPVCLSENGDTLILSWGKGEGAILYSLRDNSVKKT